MAGLIGWAQQTGSMPVFPVLANVQEGFDSFQASHDESEMNKLGDIQEYERRILELERSSSDNLKRNKELEKHQKILQKQHDDLQKREKRLKQKIVDVCNKREAKVKNLMQYTEKAFLKEQVFNRKIDTLEGGVTASNMMLKSASDTIEDLNVVTVSDKARIKKLESDLMERDATARNMQIYILQLRQLHPQTAWIHHLTAERDWLQKTKHEQELEMMLLNVSSFFL